MRTRSASETHLIEYSVVPWLTSFGILILVSHVNSQRFWQTYEESGEYAMYMQSARGDALMKVNCIPRDNSVADMTMFVVPLLAGPALASTSATNFYLVE